MKKISFSRKEIFRAIHAACVALFLAAAHSAEAQTFGTGAVNNPYTNNLSTASSYTNSSAISLTDSSGSGAYYAGLSLLPAASNTTTNSGSIQATVNSVTQLSRASGVSFDSSSGGSLTFQNNGAAISGMANNSLFGGTDGVGLSAATTSGFISITNQASGAAISGVGTGSGYNTFAAIGVQAVTTTGAITIDNLTGATISGAGSGTSSGYNAGSGAGSGVSASTTSGTVTITNGSGSTISGSGTQSASGFITPSALGYGINITGSDVVIANNGGTISGTGTATGTPISASGEGINIASTGAVTITNSGGTIGGTSSASGLYASAVAAGINLSSSTSLTLTNSALISGTSPAGNATTSAITAVSSGALSITNQAGGTISASGQGGGVNGISATDTGGSIQIANAGSVTASGIINGTAINVAASGSSPVILTNNGSVMATTIAGTASGIYVGATGSGPITITNSSSVTMTTGGSGSGIFVNNTGTGDVSITNGVGDSISANSSASSGFGIRVSNAADTTVANNGSISAPAGVSLGSTSGTLSFTNASTGQVTAIGPAVVLQTGGAGTVTLTNNGSVTSSGSYDISTSTDAGAVSVTNNGTVNTASGGLGNGITSNTNSGSDTVINNGTITGTGSAYGINTNSSSNSASMTVTNTGTITGSGYAIGARLSGSAPLMVTNSGIIANASTGIYAFTSAPASSFNIRNTGAITASNYGIFAISPATVYNTGSIHATTAISVPSGSFVTLAGISDVTGTVSGGPDPNSTSQLTFALSIPAAQLAAAQAQLAAEILAYDTQLGGNMTFTINGVSYDISNFDYTNIIGALTLPPVTRLYANTPGFQSEGSVLDNLNTNNAQASTILNALGNVPDAGVINALSELSPKELEIFSNVAKNVATFNAAKINNHLANRRDGLTGFDATALNVQDSGMDPSLNQVRSHLLAYNAPAPSGLVSDTVDSLFGGMDMKNTQVNTMPPDRWSSFIAGDVILADLSHNANLEDADYTTGNVTAGVDYRLDDHFTVGALFAYSHTNANLDSRGSTGTVDSYSPGIYASYVDKGWYGNGLATYGRNAYTSDRRVDIPGLAGDNHGGTSGNQGTINLTGGYEFQRGVFKFGPVASVQYVHLSIDSMQEQGPTALSIASQDEDSFRSQLGVEGRFVANVKTCYGPMTFTPHLSASWQHEYLDSSRGINAQFTGTGGGSFATQTDNPDRDAAFVDVGLDADVARNVTLFVDYETQAGQNDFFAQSAEGGVKIGF